MTTPKEKITELAKALREAAKRQDPLARATIQLVQLTADSLKDSLVETDGEDMLRLQGAVRHFNRLHRELTTTPPSEKPTEQ
jgi:N-acetylglucosamine kinase-like BadF-type ATPase